MVQKPRSAGRRRVKKRSHEDEEDIPDIYKEMLVEAMSSPTSSNDDRRTLKKRRLGNHSSLRKMIDDGEVNAGSEDFHQQTVENESASSRESDNGWEDVHINMTASSEAGTDAEGKMDNLDIVLDDAEGSKNRRVPAKTRALNVHERRLRLMIHEMHLLCLLAHVNIRNHWCNDSKVQAVLKPLLPARTVSYLKPAQNLSQFQRSRSFLDGLSQAAELWRGKFKIDARGLRKGVWSALPRGTNKTSITNDFDPPLERVDFPGLARSLRGSRDIGSQLFCALLRSVGVQTRLVCSLQPLPLKSSVIKDPISIVQLVPPIDSNGRHEDDVATNALNQSTEAPANAVSNGNRSSLQPLVPKVAKRLGQPSFGVRAGSTDASESAAANEFAAFKVPLKKRIRESSYPVYWVECFNAALQKWTPVDALATKTIAKALKLEPPAGDAENSMTYVVAFEEDGVARDVTKRYTKAFNAKTRKTRVEATPGGDVWWRMAMRYYARGFSLDRDQVEDAELAGREAQEPMPRNVLDFKDHPYYALERHLKRNEVIHPKTEVGKVATGKLASGGGSKNLEPIYRRRDVHRVRGVNGWYRLGRDIKPGEQPVKHSVRRKRGRSMNMDEDDSDNNGILETGLYAEFQTIPYEPPPITNGRVPKNSYGNIDVYVPSMVPRGGVHISYQEAARAARLLGLDYADAVTGFEFKGRHGTAVIRGIVTAAEHQEAIKAVIKGFQNDAAEAEASRKSMEILRVWKLFILALRVHERIGGYAIEGENENSNINTIDDNDEAGEGGGFFPDRSEERIAEPTVGRFATEDTGNDEAFGSGGGFMAYEGEEESPQSFAKDEWTGEASDNEALGGGGFMAADDEDAEEAMWKLKGGYGSVSTANHMRRDALVSGVDTGGLDSVAEDLHEVEPPLFKEFGIEQQQTGEGSFIREDVTDEQVINHRDIPVEGITTPSTDHPLSKSEVSTHNQQEARSEHAAAPRPETMATGQEQSVLASEDHKAGHQEALTHPSHSPPRLSLATATPPSLSPLLHQQDEVSEDDNSLLSHDPEDEDAEPEWLMSD